MRMEVSEDAEKISIKLGWNWWISTLMFFIFHKKCAISGNVAEPHCFAGSGSTTSLAEIDLYPTYYNELYLFNKLLRIPYEQKKRWQHQHRSRNNTITELLNFWNFPRRIRIHNNLKSGIGIRNTAYILATVYIKQKIKWKFLKTLQLISVVEPEPKGSRNF